MSIKPTLRDIRLAIEKRALEVHYMPTIDLQTGQCCGVEALVRWPREGDSFIAPDDFIPLAEAHDLAGPLTDLVIRCVSEDLGDYLAGHAAFHVAMNIPPSIVGTGYGVRAAEDSNLVRFADQIVLEITERQALTDQGRKLMNELRRLGLRVALDDFGTGHSGLAQLIDLEVDYLKIDRRFVQAMDTRNGSRLIEATAAAARVLGMELIAEGIETPDQARRVRELGVHRGQGWYWSEALPVAALLEY